ncbi:PREDICTED: mucin-2 isoform X1 [Habropoda laboriosa]|uniref:mucin-2 isoform X1 n=1 Tax=Habropoda laboriosa TaxID=597456 RepID=UPI00083DE26A|nr:PREDICTED: mucin-2 isoform X1 [Habropoda laboriosa]XP_017796345.1 PREDICTED: mucin-2 isoform X1 [Habropoda laboriosa]
MGTIVQLFLFVVLCASVGGVHGVCRHVPNEDMIEYLCVGGQLSDLDNLPVYTGKIRIQDMPVSRITQDTFSRFGSDLWVLGCSHCGITDIEDRAFQRLNNLQQLSLNNNHLTTVKESWFKGLDSLTYLDLNYNNIESVENGVFESLPSLVDLRLSGNRLECLNLEDMSHLKDLKRMFLTENSEFKCPNAVSAFLGSQGVSLEKDPEWSRLTSDLVPVELPIDYDTDDEETLTEEPTTRLPIYRERLHPPTMTPPSAVESTVPHIAPRFQTTEEVLYRPTYNTPDWRMTAKPSTVNYEDTARSTTNSPYDDPMRTYTTPRLVVSIDETTNSPPETTYNSQDVTSTLRTWPRFPESTSARPELPAYPPHRNEDGRYTEQPYYSSPINSFPLAPSPEDGERQTPTFVDPNAEVTTSLVRTDWTEMKTDDSSKMDNQVPTNHVSRPLPPSLVEPMPPDNVHQAPYYESTVTVHSPQLVNNLPQQEEVTPGAVPIETTTDKPLPNCPTRNSSPSSSQSSVAMIVVSVFLLIRGRVLVEGF